MNTYASRTPIADTTPVVIPTPPGKISVSAEGTFGGASLAMQASDYSDGSNPSDIIDDEADGAALSFTAPGQRRVIDGGLNLVVTGSSMGSAEDLFIVVTSLERK